MYGLSNNVDLSFFLKRKLELVCFAAYSLYLHFDGDILLTIEGDFYCGPNMIGDMVPWSHLPVFDSDLMKFLESEIVKVDGDPNGTLSLTFSNGETLKVSGDNGPFEAYSIKHGEDMIIV